MIRFFLSLFLAAGCASCHEAQQKSAPAGDAGELPLRGTWKLITGTLIQGGDTLVTDFTKDRSFIKIINDTHFSFLTHGVAGKKDSAQLFSAGGGRYSLKGAAYTEYLEYCSAPQWEGHEFKFRVQMQGDTLVQSGQEEVASAGVSRMNIERYVRLKD